MKRIFLLFTLLFLVIDSYSKGITDEEVTLIIKKQFHGKVVISAGKEVLMITKIEIVKIPTEQYNRVVNMIEASKEETEKQHSGEN